MEISLLSEVERVGEPGCPGGGLVAAQQRLRGMVLDTLPSSNSRRNYSKALDDLFAFAAGRPLTRELVLAFRASLEGMQNPSGDGHASERIVEVLTTTPLDTLLRKRHQHLTLPLI